MEKRVRFIRKKNNYFLLIVIILFAFILNNKIVNAETLTLEVCSKNDANVLSTTDIDNKSNCLIKFNGDINKINKIATKINSINLQKALDDVSENGGGTVTMPSGRFYFSYLGRPYHFTGENHITGEKSDDREDKDNYEVNAHQRYAIRVRNNVTLTGSIYKGGYPATILAIYHEEIIDKNDHGIDMFYYNNIRDTGYATKKYGTELHVKWKGYKLDDVTNNKLYWFGSKESISMNNVTFKDFIIDGDYNAAYSYESSGNGFRTSFYQNCVWDNVIVMNTNATGFGCDYPKNSIIKNSKAINCGKEAKEYYIDKDGTVWDGGIERAPGGSGFGIGTGYSDEESLIITECEAFNNAKFGFFFEQQSRFGNKKFNSIKGKFVVKDSIAGGNMFDYGGLYSTGAIYDNVKSVSGNKSYTSSTGITAKDKKTINLEVNNQPEKHESHPLRFGMFSANNYIINSDLSSALKDNVTNEEVKNSIKWAVNSGVLDVDINTQKEYDAGNYGTYFRPTSDVTRFDAIVALYKFNNMPMKLQPESGPNHFKSLQTYFDEINVADAAELYGNQEEIAGSGTLLSLTKYKKAGDLDALKWAYENKIVMKGKSSSKFNFDNICDRAMIVSFLYRMAGSPEVNNTISFSDVKSSDYFYDAVRWAVAKNIVKGTGGGLFSPDEKVNKQTLAVFLKRYYDNIIHTVKFVTNGGTSISDQKVKHGDKISQVNPTKTGYTFNGWYSDKELEIKNDFTLNFTINGNSENYSFSTPVTSNKTLYAKWTANTYTIKYTMNRVTAKTDETGTFDEAKKIANPGKIFTVIINTNSQSATIKDSEGKNVTSASAAQEFAGWTSSSKKGLGLNAKTGTSESGATTAWTGKATKDTYFMNLRDTSGDVTLTATWTAVDVKLPKITKTGYTCGYAESASGTIKYASEANYTPSTTAGSVTLYAKCNANTYTIKYTMNGAAAKADETGTFDIAKNIANPSKTFTVNINANSQSATIKNSGGTDVTSASVAQTFAGWTSNSSAGLGSNAKTGTSASGATTVWAGAATKNTYFKNLRDTAGDVTLTATWTAVAVKLPKITKTGYTCGYAESASGTIKYASEANYTPSTTTESVTLYAKCNANTYTIKYTMNGAAAKADETGTFDIAKNIANPSKTFTVNINANSQSATIKNSGGTDVTSASVAQTFAGWTSNSSAGLGSNAKTGTSASGATTVWAGAAAKDTYFMNLRDTSGDVTLTATWTAVDIKLPKITKTGYTCGYAESASGTIKYASEANYTPSTTTESVTLYAKCNANTHVNNTVDYEGIYDGKDHTISINVELDNYVIKYSVGNTNYDLTELPKFKDVGEYTINYKISSNGYDDLIGSNKVKIYGIKKIDSSIKIKDNKLIIHDNSFNLISNKITVYSISNEFKHYNKNNELVSNDILKTSDVVKIVLNETSTYEYRVVFLGDNSGDGQINSADLLKVRKHLLNSSILTDIYYMASDVDSDGDIDSADLLRVRQHLLGKIKI